MKLPFLDRDPERVRLTRLVARPEPSLAAVFGRRRCGKSRLLREVLPTDRTVMFVADDREAPLQRAALAREIGRRLPGFGRVTYPDWEPLLERWWEEAPRGSVLALDEFPSLVQTSPELPSLLQKLIDGQAPGRPHLVLSGSSQRMMQGLVFDRNAPLFGRATEILEILPLAAGWLRKVMGRAPAARVVEAFSVWGGVPRYWELAADHPDLGTAITDLVLSPLGVLHGEPASLLLDDLRDTTQAATILAVIGQGAHKLSQIAGRVGKPATSLSRPLQRLLELRLVRRDLPWGTTARDTKRTLYRIADPFLRFWFRFVEPERTRLESGQIDAVAREVECALAAHVAGTWEELVRTAIPRGTWFDRSWRPAASWWGPGSDRTPLALDVVAESTDGHALLVGEVKWGAETDVRRLAADLTAKAARFPLVAGRKLCLGLWLARRPTRKAAAGIEVFGPAEVLDALDG